MTAAVKLKKTNTTNRCAPRSSNENKRRRKGEENEGMSKWQDGLVRGDGYMINGGVISRNAVVDATIAGAVRKTQTVHRYEYFNPADAKLKADLSAGAIAGLEADAIMQIANSATLEVKAWGNKLFGNGDIEAKAVARAEAVAKLEAKFDAAIAGKLKAGDVQAVAAATAEYVKALEKLGPAEKLNRGGEFGRHMGYAPKFKDGEDINFKKSKDWNVKENGMGQMHLIMLDFQWNAMEEGKGYGELSQPMYDRKMWEDGGWLEAPTLRGLADMGAQIVGTIVGAALSAVLSPIGGAALGAGITLGMQLTNNLLFATLDTEVTGRDAGKVWSDFGKTMSLNTVSAAVSFGVGAAGIGIGKAVTNEAISAGTAALAKGAISAGSAYTSSVATSYLYALDFQTGTFDRELLAKANESWYSANTIASTLGAGVSAGLGSYLSTAQAVPDILQEKFSNVLSFTAGMAGEAVKYGVYAAYDSADKYELTLNLMSVATIANLFGVENADKMGVGLFEISIGSNGVSGRLGTGGIDVSGVALDIGRWGVESFQAWNAARKQPGITEQMLEGYFSEEQMSQMMSALINGEPLTNAQLTMLKMSGLLVPLSFDGENSQITDSHDQREWEAAEKMQKEYEREGTPFRSDFFKKTGQTTTEVLDWYNTKFPDKQITEGTLITLFTDRRKAMILLITNKTLHRDLREQLNINGPETRGEAEAKWDKPLPPEDSVFHAPFFPFYNTKWVEPEYGHIERVFDKNGNRVTNNLFKDSFNFFSHKTNSLGHFMADVIPWLIWGN
ncbi:MAG: hypothetical protein LBH44_13965 [Treponema sp.]|jgi:hypothetical protein|nr:hypothetical protein [Treponema sp.]